MTSHSPPKPSENAWPLRLLRVMFTFVLWVDPCTPWKINMEPQKHSVLKESSLPKGPFPGSMLISGVYIPFLGGTVFYCFPIPGRRCLRPGTAEAAATWSERQRQWCCASGRCPSTSSTSESHQERHAERSLGSELVGGPKFSKFLVWMSLVGWFQSSVKSYEQDGNASTHSFRY